MGKPKIKFVDTTMRDGSHALSNTYTVPQVSAIAGGLDRVGVDIIEISHGDGLAGASFNYGFSKTPEMELIRAVKNSISRAKLGVLLIPGIGTVDDLEEARENGAEVVRIATHCTEADISPQSIGFAKKMGMKVVGFLMMIHQLTGEQLAEQARVFVDCGVDYVNLADSAGYLMPDGVRRIVSAVKKAVPFPVGFHAHNNMGFAIANSLAAIEEGAEYIDVTCRGLGAGAGNAQAEVLAAVLDRAGYDTGIDLYGIMDLAEDVVEPIMPRPQVIRTASLMLGYAGVYSSFLLHAYRAAEKFGLHPRDILVELGRRKMVGGQEDKIIEVAYEISMAKEAATKS